MPFQNTFHFDQVVGLTSLNGAPFSASLRKISQRDIRNVRVSTTFKVKYLNAYHNIIIPQTI